MKMGKKEIFRGIGIKKFRAAFFALIIIGAVFVSMVGNVSALQFFFDDMDPPNPGWTASGLWHITTDRSYSPTQSWVYNDGTDYDTGLPNTGNLTSPTIDLTTATIGNLTFWTWYETEGGTTYDQMWIQISEDGGPFMNEYQINPTSMMTWVQISLNITSHVGHNIQVRFFFDTVDDIMNNYEGWYIDDVEVNDIPLPPTSTFEPPHSDYGLDTDGNGLFNYLIVNVTLNITVAGNYIIEGTLLDPFGGWIDDDTNFTFLNAGIQIVELRFEGWLIRNNMVDGPYEVQLELYDDSWNSQDTDVYFTPFYGFNQFELPPAELFPPYSDYGLDTDGDGLFNYLIVNVTINVSVAGDYIIDGTLEDIFTNWIDDDTNFTFLNAGIQTVQLWFEGGLIRANGVDGPYNVYIDLYDDSWNWMDSDSYTTSFYGFNQFELPPAELFPPYSDYGLDTDGDGFFNYLVVNVTVNVSTAADYRVYGELYDPLMVWLDDDMNFTFLNTGLQVVQLYFDGTIIYDNGENGSYRVDLELLDASWNLLDNDMYFTNFYNYDQFQPPSAWFEPPHSDYGLDTDGDGFFNYLVVNITVNVSVAGDYRVDASLFDPLFNFIQFVSNTTFLNTGVQVVQLYYSGSAIYNNGQDGPYTVFLELLDNLSNSLDTDMHSTGVYSYTQFQPSNAAFDPPHSDYGLDTDIDTYYNYLVVNVSVNVTTAGNYTVNGTLMDSAFNFVDFQSNFTFLNPGIQTVQLYFDGMAIYNNGVDGNFNVYLELFDNLSNLQDTELYTTNFYLYNQFQPPPVNPWATATGPVSALTNNASPTITYNFGNGPTSVEIYWSDDGGASWNLWGADTSVDGSWPAGSPLPASGTYVWSARAIGATNESVPSGPGDIEAGPYVLDIDAPTIISTTPTDGATGVSTAAGTYVIEFNESMDLVGTPLTDLPGIVWTWDPSGLWLNGTYTALAPSTTYYVDLTGLGFQDLAGNALTGDTYKNFTTAAVVNPWANATGPISALTNNATPTITYNFGNGPTSVEIYWSDDGGTSWNLWGTDTSVDGSWPAGSPLAASGTYDWSVRAIGAINESVPSGPGDIEAASYVLDIDAPTIISTTPTDGATGVSTVAGTYVIEFSEPMSPMGTPITDLPPGVVWTWDPSGLWLNGTYTVLNPGTTYNVNLTGMGFHDLITNDLAGDMDKNFTTAAAPGPWAVATGPISALTNNATPTINYSFGNGPTNVQIYWSDDGGASWNLWGTDVSVDGSWPAASPLPASGTYVWSARAIGAPSEPVPSGPGDVEAASYVLDIDAPTIISTTPTDGATGVSTVAGTYVIEFSEPMSPMGTPFTDLPPGVVWTWDPSGLWLNGTYTVLNPGTTYNVNLTGMGFHDLITNDLTGDMDKNFTTGAVADPWANATGPISGLTNNPSPTITYNFGNGPTSVEIYWSDDGGASWNLWGTDTTVDGSWPSASPLPASGTYDWSARAIGATNESIPSGPGDIEAGSYVLDIDAPTIFSTTPIDGAIDVSTVAGTYVIRFSEPMSPVGTPTSDLPGLVWTWDASGLWLNGTYTALLTSTTYYVDLTGLGFQDLAGNALTGDTYKDFTTQPPDTTPPTVVSGAPTSPPAVSVGANIVIVFNESMNATSVENAFSISPLVSGAFTWTLANTTMTFNPSANLGYSTIYTVKINGSIAKDLNDNTLDGNKNGTAEGSPIDDHSWSFITQPPPDTTKPISSVSTLPTYESSLSFDITYTASDAGSGVRDVELWYQKDGGIWTLYNTYIGSTSPRTVTFTADSDGEYNFYTRAIDNENNYEDAPVSADAYTTVDTTPPTVDAGSDVSTNSEITQDASASDDTSGIDTYEWTQESGPGTITFGDDAAEDTTVSADTDGTYVIRLTVTDIAGNTEYDEFTLVWDTTSPTVTAATPTGTEVQITSTISITFNEAMNHASVHNAFNFTDGTTVWTIANGSVSWVGNTMTFTPTNDLSYGTSYNVNIGTSAQDHVGNGLATVYTWSFTTAQAPDTTSPTVSSVSLEGDDVEVTNELSITFDEPMDHASVEGAITISPGVEIINYSWVGNTLTITFETDLEHGTEYTVTIGTGAEDEAGNSLEEPHTWDFTTKEKEEEAAFPLWLLLLIVIIVIVILLVLFLMKGKKKPEELPEEKAAEEIGPETEEEIGEEAEKAEGELPGEEAKEGLGEEGVEKEVEKPEGEAEKASEEVVEEEKKEPEEL